MFTCLIGVSYKGSTPVSKTVNVGSIPTTPAILNVVLVEKSVLSDLHSQVLILIRKYMGIATIDANWVL